MTIRERGYEHWSGEFAERRLPWWPITRLGIKLTFKKKFFKLTFFVSLVPAVVYLIGVYLSERIEDFRGIVIEGRRFLEVNPIYFESYFTGEFLIFMMVMILVFCGTGLISDDLKYNSLQLYFSRPIKKKDYFLGKASVIFFFLLMVTLVPGLVFFIMKLVFSGSFQFVSSYPWLLLSIVGYSVLVTVFFSFYTLLLSSASKNRRYVSILIFTIYIFSDILFGIFYGIFRNPYFALISLRSNIQQLGAFLFRVKPQFDVPWIYSFLVLAVVCLFAAFVLDKKVRGIEVIK